MGLATSFHFFSIKLSALYDTAFVNFFSTSPKIWFKK
jgi:hypothetical protein